MASSRERSRGRATIAATSRARPWPNDGPPEKKPVATNDVCSTACHAADRMPSANTSGICHPMIAAVEAIQHTARWPSAGPSRCSGDRRTSGRITASAMARGAVSQRQQRRAQQDQWRRDGHQQQMFRHVGRQPCASSEATGEATATQIRNSPRRQLPGARRESRCLKSTGDASIQRSTPMRCTPSCQCQQRRHLPRLIGDVHVGRHEPLLSGRGRGVLSTFLAGPIRVKHRAPALSVRV